MGNGGVDISVRKMEVRVKDNRKEIQSRLERLRRRMREERIDVYLITTSDYHNSEYVNDYFKVREYFSGFTGSNGTLAVSEEQACLWTDGRYFVQAEKELSGTGICLMRMGEEGVPSLEAYLVCNMKQGQILGFDGRCVGACFGRSLETRLSEQNIGIRYEVDLAEGIWENRPPLPGGAVLVLPESLHGMGIREKTALVRKGLEHAGAEALLLNRMDDIMWLLNIRGEDVPCNPVALSYVWLNREKLYIFLQGKAMDGRLREYFDTNNIMVREYGDIIPFLKNLPAGQKVLADMQELSWLFYKLLQEKQILVEGDNPAQLLKAVKNPVELSNMEEVYRQDSAALTKFIYWLKKNIGTQEIDEMSAAAYLDSLRRRIDGFLDLSFPTISAYQENGAMCHYETTPESNKKLHAKGFYLVDSGAQYLGGTTDVTRTLALGEATDEMKRHFTAVACGMLRLSRARFLEGCSGRNLDILARAPLWDCNLDYKHGTGHGVGYMLNVHEGPHSIRWKYSKTADEAVLEEGMAVSNEPGVYLEGKYGIRTENILVVRKGVKNEYGQFLHFDTLTWVPIDKDALDSRYMTAEDLVALNEYHRKVYEKISPLLEEDERKWLKEATAPYF